MARNSFDICMEPGEKLKETQCFMDTGTGGREISNFNLAVGEIEVSFWFDTHTEMIKFCKKHNFKYSDNREK